VAATLCFLERGSVDERDVDRARHAVAQIHPELVGARGREVLGFIAEVNAARRARYGVLLQRAEERGLPPGWAEQLFKPGPGAKRSGGKQRKSAGSAKAAKSAAQPPASQARPE